MTTPWLNLAQSVGNTTPAIAESLDVGMNLVNAMGALMMLKCRRNTDGMRLWETIDTHSI